MTYLSSDTAFIVTAIMFASIVAMHLSRKNDGAVRLYVVQSAAVLALFFAATVAHVTMIGVLVAALMLVIKMVAAPHFFHRLIRRHQLTFSASAYTSASVTLALITLMMGASYLQLESAFASLAPLYAPALTLAFAGMLAALFLIINRKGALSQMLGVLSLENSIIAFAALAGLEHAPMLELGVIFDTFIWIMIATVFVSMIYEKFGSLDVTALTRLAEE